MLFQQIIYIYIYIYIHTSIFNIFLYLNIKHICLIKFKILLHLYKI